MKALILSKHKMFQLQHNSKDFEQTGSAHRGLSPIRQARSEPEPSTCPFDFMHFLAQHVQGYVAGQSYLRHLPVMKKEGDCVARSMQPDDNASLPTLFFTRAARRHRRATVRPPGILLSHHVQTRSRHVHSLFRLGPNRTNSLNLPGTFHCVEAVRRRTLSQASRKGHRTSSHE